ncbi:MAG TPA: GNAT family N-acetyltransferase [Flavobacteriales bacterium]|nr:GNAT family N-acetyltransferase [Flavobacteriales bacterium]
MIAEGNLVFLRKPRMGDEDIMLIWENDESLWYVSDTTEKFSREDMENFVRSDHDVFRQKQLRLMICEKKDSRPVGCVDLFEFDEFHKRAGVGILIYEEADKRKGYASQALDLLANYCKKDLGLKQLFCSVLTDNESSVRLFEKNAYVKAGEKKAWRRIGNKWKDEFIMQRMLS